MSNTELLTPGEAADFLGLSPGTLAIWPCKKRYPLRYVRVGSRVKYRRRDLEAFLDARTAGVTEQKQANRHFGS
jgi:excisionase family DNA binding protein